ncbi:MAG: hypothetical protein IJC18_05100, partial [Clostridia bacterium]|nr:hypothetical protein [Clostridia bacterium]
MKKILAVLLSVVLLACLFTGCDGCGGKITPDSSRYRGVLRIAVDSDIVDTGVVEHISEKFLNTTGWELEIIGGSAEELTSLASSGGADLLMLYYGETVQTFIADGCGESAFETIANDYIVVGPADGIIEPNDSLSSLFDDIRANNAVFISRGDGSHAASFETALWRQLGITADFGNYIVSGANAENLLTMADTMGGVCITDRASWLTFCKEYGKESSLEILCEGDERLANKMVLVTLDATELPDTQTEGANAFIEWMRSEDAVKMIGKYGE